jgi:hypothetical protein
MNQKRQPKGTDTGGQFAASANPESTVELDDGLTGSTEPRGTAQKIAARLRPGTVIECVENTHIPNTAGVAMEITKSGSRAFTGSLLHPGGRENLKIGNDFDLHIGTGATLDGDRFSSNLVINGKVVGRSTWRFVDANEAVGHIDTDTASETCPGCGGASVRDLPAYDPSNRENPFPSRTVRTCADCGHQLAASGASVPEADKQQYIDSIHKNLDDSGSYDPNDEGVKLINESSMKITGELETHNGIAWNGELTIGDEILYVSNNGNGGSNHYDIKDGGWKRIEELNDRVSTGFPGLAGAEALDSFCLVAEVARLDRLGDET